MGDFINSINERSLTTTSGNEETSSMYPNSYSLNDDTQGTQCSQNLQTESTQQTSNLITKCVFHTLPENLLLQ